MTQYISKADLVAEINQRIEDYKSHKIDDSYHDGLIFALEDLRDDFINTLEVREVDLDVQDIYGILYLERIVMRDFGDKEYSHEELCQEVLKRFKAHKGE